MNKEGNNIMKSFKIKLINNNKNSNNHNRIKNSQMPIEKVKIIKVKNLKQKRIINTFKIEILMMV